jgi:hypothetical protein
VRKVESRRFQLNPGQFQERLLAWLDYDRSLDPEVLQDIDGVCSRLAPKSILIVTTDARPKLPKDQYDLDALPVGDRERIIYETFNNWFAQYVTGKIQREASLGSNVAPLFYEVIVERIRRTLATRGLQFIQFFNYIYRDGAPMLTLGGLIGTGSDEVALRTAGVLNHRFVRTGGNSLVISVPPLTLREKHWLDSRLYGKINVAKLSFELDKELLENYCTFYKEYPTYMETFL